MLISNKVNSSFPIKNVIIDGTQNLLESSYKHGVEHFIYLSTAEVYGNVSGQIDESHLFGITGNEYGDSKIEAEKLCMEYWEKGLPITILRPSIIYGLFSKTWSIGIAERLLTKKWKVLQKNGNGICNLIFIFDLLDFIFKAICNKNSYGQVFNVNNNDKITWNEYLDRKSTRLNSSHTDISRMPSSA